MANEPHSPAIIKPRFETMPSADDLARYFPIAAQISHVTGGATIRCYVALTHRLENCIVTSEDPVGFGFGDAALKVARLFNIAPQSVNGVPVAEGVLTTRIRFQLPDVENPSSGSVGHYVIYVPWLKEPSPEQITAVYPSAASGVGYAALVCGLRSDGNLHECHLTGENPKKMGFGEAAFTLAPLFTAGPPPFTPGEAPLAVMVQISFRPPSRQTPVPNAPPSRTP